MYIVEKEFNIAIAHRLSKHDKEKNLCVNIHGHGFKIIVALSCKILNVNDMVIDFSDLKDIVNEVVNKWDHSLILNSIDKDNISINFNQKTVYINGDPTSENLCKLLYDKLYTIFYEKKLDVNVEYVKIYESPTSSATYKKD